MENKPNKEWLQKIGKLEEVGWGYDSTVEKFSGLNSDVAVKEYADLMATFGSDLTKEILIAYNTDTERVFDLVEQNHNPLNQTIEINENPYQFNYMIVPQGGVLLEGKPNDRYTTEPNPVVISQKFVKGKNFRDIFDGKREDNEKMNEQDGLYGKPDLAQEIWTSIQRFADYIQENLQIRLIVVPENVKPFIDVSDHQVDIVVTDLTGSLADYFYSSPSTEPLREQWQKVMHDSQN